MVIGTRCQLSEEAKRRGLKTYRWRHGEPLEYVGTVVGESGECWLVLWDGLKYSRPLEKALIAPRRNDDREARSADSERVT